MTKRLAPMNITKHWVGIATHGRRWVGLGLALAVSAVAGLTTARAADAELAPLPLKLPIPAFMGTPTDLPMGPEVEKLSDKPRPPFLAPKGVQNLALKKKVSSSDKAPITGTLDLVTDGDKESNDNSYVELHRKTQWVQVDLGKPGKIYAIVIWHAHNTYQVYHDVIVQLADDADFTQNVRTVFNNDQHNDIGLGVGTDKQYFENYEGKLIPVKGLDARYVRCYSRGSSYSALNRYTEIEVWGLPGE